MPMVTQKLRDPDVNPCLSESDASTRCMDENNYDKERCSAYFLKYRSCRKFWQKSLRDMSLKCEMLYSEKETGKETTRKSAWDQLRFRRQS
uniref:Coiled-coil-helix-coiled-coil-helix domain-containing protein 7 n=1 Tax=Camelus bactrianus TaxID=9837 RepID=A0A9W3H8S1_CAMBA|nr:coiled-coil-helix-coiled-coil-helix domain-containing protein 7 [Camelus bactrianus]